MSPFGGEAVGKLHEVLNRKAFVKVCTQRHTYRKRDPAYTVGESTCQMEGHAS
jgi:hypothetical protein